MVLMISLGRDKLSINHASVTAFLVFGAGDKIWVVVFHSPFSMFQHSFPCIYNSTRLFGSLGGLACVIQLTIHFENPPSSHFQNNSTMVIDGTSSAASEAVALFDSGIRNDDALPPIYNKDPLNEGRAPLLKHSFINPPNSRITNQPPSHTPHQDAEKGRHIATNVPHNPYVRDNTNVPINPSAFVTPAATATFDAATSLQGSV